MKTRYSLTANSRKSYGFTAALVVLSLTVISLTANAATDSWTGASTASWSDDGSWLGNSVPTAGDTISFDSNSTANLSTTLDAPFDVGGIVVGSPSGAVTISAGSGGTITIDAGGIDMSAATQNLTIGGLSSSVFLQIGATQTWNVASGATLTLSATSYSTFDLGGYTVVKSGSGVLALNGVNIADGTLEIASGTGNVLQGYNSQNNGIAATGTVQIDSGAVLSTAGSSGTFTLNGTMAMNGGTWDINTQGGTTNHVLNGTVTVSASGGTIYQMSAGNNNAANLASAITSVATSGTAILNLSSSSTSAGGLNSTGVISDGTAGGKLAINVSGGNVTISGSSNTYSGGTVISGGILAITNGNALSSGTLTFANGGTQFTISNTSAMAVANNIVLSTSGTDTLSKTVTSASAGTQVTFSGNISGGSVSTVLYLNTGTSGDNTTNFNFAGNNTFVVSEINLNRGTITVNSANSLGASTNLVYLDGNNNQTSGDLQFASSMTFANPIQLAISNDPIGTGGNNVTLSGTMSGSGGLTKVASGNLTLTAANTYTGATAVSAGTLITGNSSALGTSSSVSITGGTLQVGDGVNNALTGIGALTINGGVLDLKTNTGSISLASGKNFSLTLGTWMLNGNSTTTGAGIDQITLSGGTYALTSGTVDLSGFTAGAGTYNIINGTGTVGALTFINGQAGYTYSFDTNGDLIIAVPEPSTITLTIIFGAGMLLLFRRRFGNRGSR